MDRAKERKMSEFLEYLKILAVLFVIIILLAVIFNPLSYPFWDIARGLMGK